MNVDDHALEQYRTMVETVPDGVYTLDADFHFRAVNDGLVALTGYSREELLGAPASLVLGELTLEQAAERREYLKAHPDEVLTARYDLHPASGDSFPVEVRFTALEFESTYRGTAGVIRDVSERVEQECELQRQRDELDELNRINAVIRDIDQALLSADTREAVEQAVCNRLAAADAYEFAWTAEFGPGYETMTPRARAGVESGYLTSVLDVVDDDRAIAEGPAAIAMQTRTVNTVQRIDEDDAFAPWRREADDSGFESLAAIPLVHEDDEYGVLVVYASRPNAFDERETAVLGELGGTISHAIAAIERRGREQTLTALHESTRELLHTETSTEISQLVVETAVTDLDLEAAALYRFDAGTNTLAPEAAAGTVGSALERAPTLAPGSENPIWRCFIEDRSRIVDDVDDLAVFPAAVDLAVGMLVPLGEHGVLVVASASAGSFTDNTKRLVDLMAATTEAAFDRVAGEAELRERDEELRARNAQLTKLNRLNELIREVDQGLIQATARAEIEQVVCERLTTDQRFRFAWIGALDGSHEQVVPRARNGAGRGYLDSVDLSVGPAWAEPAAVTARTGDITRIQNVAEGLRDASWRPEAFSREFQSVISVPLTYGDQNYGVLTVYAAAPGLFDEREAAVLGELGQTVANAINAVEMKETLLTDSVVELDFRLHGDTQRFLPRLGRHLEAEVRFESILHLADGDTRVFFTVHGASAEECRAVLDEFVSVESSRLVAEDEDGCLFDAVVSGPTVAATLVEHGASPRSITVTGDETRVVIELPQRAHVRGFIERFQAAFADVEFVARRDRDRPIQSRQGFRAAMEDSLTDRQLDILKTAFYSGYFESPRKTTGQELAEVLGVSAPTVASHLREGERRFLSLVFDE